MKKTPRRAVIVGATLGIGYEIALLLVQEGWRLGIAGRRKENLEALQAQYPDQICIRAFDIRQSGAEMNWEVWTSSCKAQASVSRITPWTQKLN